MRIKLVNKYSFVLFLLTLAIIIIHEIAMIFPALIIKTLDSSIPNVNTFELGYFAPHIIASNTLFFGILFLNRKKKLSIIQKFISFIQNFDLGSKTALLCLIIIVGIYIALTFDEILIPEIAQWRDYKGIEKELENWPSFSFSGGASFNFVNNSLFVLSKTMFGNVRVLPFLASILILILTYYVTSRLAEKRLSGIISTVILFQSYLFRFYDTSATYSYFWVLFYMLSVFFISNKPNLSPLFFVLSILSKPLSLLFMPGTLLIVSRSAHPRNKKIRLFLIYITILVIIITGTLFAFIGFNKELDYFDMLMSLSSWGFQLRFEWILLTFILPVVYLLYQLSKQGNLQGDNLLALLLVTTSAQTFMTFISDYNVQPYREIPLILFFSIAVGTILMKPKNHVVSK